MTVKQTQPTAKQQADMYVMIGKQMASSYPWWAMLIAFVVGLLIGWMVLGWLIWPVQWSQAKPSILSNDPANQKAYMQSYLNFAATTYGTNSMSIEQVAQYLGEGWTVQDITAVLDQMISSNYASNKVYLEKFRNDLNVAVQTGKAQIGPATASTNQPGIPTAVAITLAIIAFLLLIAVAVWLFLRFRSDKPEVTVVSAPTTTTVGAEAVVVPAVSRAAGGARPVEKTAWPGETRAPLTQFATTYAFGDDRYDMSSSIETSDGDFLGECGVGISESLGGTPEKVTALEVWVFDKNDVRTVTKVLMSDYAFNDSALRAKLAPKGDAVLAQPGEVVELRTQTLKINARIVDVVYGGGTPANSYFQQITLELATWSDSQ
jgi:hypothetical protein